jgi:soluble lytic murein transglycosylase-like protein
MEAGAVERQGWGCSGSGSDAQEDGGGKGMMSELQRGQVRRRSLLLAVAVLLCVAVHARAAERVTLRHGFPLTCDHHALMDGRIRLYLSAGEDNYIDFAQDEIAAFETIPDPPVAATPATPQTSTRDSKLTTADLHEMLARAGTEHNLDVDLLASVVKAESDGNARAVSRAGARGLMQLMPGTAADLGVQDSFQPEQNVRGGSAYLDALLKRYDDNLTKALAAYNAGPEAVDKYHGIPPYRETRAYVARVIHEFNRRVLAREAEEKHAASARAAQPVASR